MLWLEEDWKDLERWPYGDESWGGRRSECGLADSRFRVGRTPARFLLVMCAAPLPVPQARQQTRHFLCGLCSLMSHAARWEPHWIWGSNRQGCFQARRDASAERRRLIHRSLGLALGRSRAFNTPQGKLPEDDISKGGFLLHKSDVRQGRNHRSGTS